MHHIKVHVWRPKDGNVGHCSMSLPDGGYISWWPNGVCSRETPSLPAQPHTDFKQDADAEKDMHPPTYYIQVNEEQIKTIKEWWQDFKTGNKYHFITNNCSTVVFIALKMAFPCLQCFETEVKVWVPLAIQLIAEQLNSGQNNLSEEAKAYFSDKVETVKEAAVTEATEIARNGGIKSSKVEKVQKLLCNPAKTLTKKFNEDESPGKKGSNNDKSPKVNKKESEVQHTSETSKKADGTGKQGSQTSKEGDETGKQVSQTSKKGDETGKQGSQTSKKGDETGKQVSQTSKKADGTGKQVSQTSKKGDETGKQVSQTSKKGDETGKQVSQTSKKGDETGKQVSQTSKKGNETGKQGSQTSKKGDEVQPKSKSFEVRDEIEDTLETPDPETEKEL